ncbi:MAG: cupin domain-containing protein [Planctomycetes bacterium]|nr:cupin domain-containing protein [Planctomycetota bacterium]
MMRHLPTPFALVALALALPAQRTPPKVLWQPSGDVATKLSNAAQPFLPLFTLPTLTVGRYRLAKGAVDAQEPHARDEVYHVLAGTAKLEVGGETRAVGPGDAVFVAAQVPHRFLDIEADLDVLVFFTAMRAPTGGMAAAPAPTEQTPFPETSQRGNTRIFYWFGPDSAGQVAIDHGQPRWQPAYAKFLDDASGKRWRFGENFWTTLDTNIPIELGGVAVPIGQHYCVLQATADGPQLVLLDPSEVRKRRLDAYEADKTKGGIVVPLETVKLDTHTSRLELELTTNPKAKDTGSLTIRFGPHTWTTALRLHPHRG